MTGNENGQWNGTDLTSDDVCETRERLEKLDTAIAQLSIQDSWLQSLLEG